MPPRPAPGYDAAEEFLDRQTPIQRVQAVLHTYPWLSPAIVLVLAMIVFSLLSATNFATPSNLGHDHPADGQSSARWRSGRP